MNQKEKRWMFYREVWSEKPALFSSDMVEGFRHDKNWAEVLFIPDQLLITVSRSRNNDFVFMWKPDAP